MNRDLLILFIRVISNPKTSSTRLLQNTMEAISIFFSHDSALALSDESSSIRDYFEATGGIEALSHCQMHPNANIQTQATELLQIFFDTGNYIGGESGEIGGEGDIFSQRYQANGLDSNQPFRKDSWEASSEEENNDTQDNEEGGQKKHYYYTNIKEDEKIVYIDRNKS